MLVSFLLLDFLIYFSIVYQVLLDSVCENDTDCLVLDSCNSASSFAFSSREEISWKGNSDFTFFVCSFFYF